MTVNSHEICRDRFLLIFGEKACTRRRLYESQEGKYLFFLAKDELMLGEDEKLLFWQKESDYFLGENKLHEDQPCYYQTAGREKLMLILTESLDRQERAGRLLLQGGEICQIGKAYKNRLFYDCFGLVEAQHASIWLEQGEFFINPETEGGGIYVNGRVLTRKRKISQGDQIDIMGLHLLLCGEIFLCVSFAGITRIAGEGKGLEERYHKDQAKKAKTPVLYERIVEREWKQGSRIHTGEVEILTPKPKRGKEETPVLLSLGPSMTMVFPMVAMALIGSRLMDQGQGFYLLSLVTGVCSALLALFWGIVNYGYKKHGERRYEKHRIGQYREYLQRMRQELTGYREENRKALEEKYPAAESFLKSESGTPVVLWNRYFRQKDFLFFRLGIGSADFQVQLKLVRKSGDIVPDALYQEGGELVREFSRIESVPLGIDFFKTRRLGILADADKEENYFVLFALFVQLAACHCYTEVKVACFYDKKKRCQQRLAEGIRWMPHIWSPDRKTRFLAGDEKESGEIIPALMSELEKGQGGKGIGIPWYLVLVLDQELVEGETLFGYLAENQGEYPVSAIFMARQKEFLPKSCGCTLTWRDQEEILYREEEGIISQVLKLEKIQGERAEKYFRDISGIRVRESGLEERLPDQVDFLGLYGCTCVWELEISRRWKKNNPAKRLKVPIGCGRGGRIVSLDIHEKFHGPHGLIAGTTGFGKSELILTFLLSVATNFSPEDVNFFIIDYKGGGTGNMLSSLPHCAGVISNLSGKQIKRAMSAITSENKRRQRLLSQCGVNHIDGYTALYHQKSVQEPMPHLILVVDEFAQLRKEEPEFMQEIISLSQVGRSLGIHLILATQKPAGTVDDRIWSNARFHLCLKVQDRQDSMDMLHNGDAALLTSPGQCYLQIGSREYYELFQAGYCGGDYIEEREAGRNTAMVERTGRRIKAEDGKKERKASQMEMVIQAINLSAKEEGLKKADSLWMPELPERLTFNKLEDKIRLEEEMGKDGEKEKPMIEILLGLCDDPGSQRQFPLYYRPDKMGHMALCGGPVSGKSTFLKLIIWQLLTRCGQQQTAVVCVDMGQANMERFDGLPGVAGVLSEKAERDVFFYHLERLFQKRKDGFSKGADKYPWVFVVIDNFAAMYSTLTEKQQQFLYRMAGEGMGYGIYLILSASSPAEIPGKVYEKIKTTLAFEMSDHFSYGDILRQYTFSVLPKENTAGRGLCKVGEQILEFQAAFFENTKKETVQAEQAIRTMKPFLRLPRERGSEVMWKEYTWKENRIPLGYSLATGEIRELNFLKAPVFLLSHGADEVAQVFLTDLAISMELAGKKVVWIWDRRYPVKETGNFMSEEELLRFHKEEREGCCLIIADLADFIKKIGCADEMRSERIRFWEELAAGKRREFFLTGAYRFQQDSYLMTEPFFRELSAWQIGIHLGGNGGAQRVFSFDDLGYARLNQREPEGIGYWKPGIFSPTERLLIPGIMKENQDDD